MHGRLRREVNHEKTLATAADGHTSALQLVHSQQVHHAPTVEQCRDDQRLWLSQINEQPQAIGLGGSSAAASYGTSS